VIEFFHVTKRYDQDTVALRDITLKIEKGEFVFITGPSGAGKSTLLKLIIGLEEPSEGQILILGRNISRLPRRELQGLRRLVGFVFQDFRLLRSQTVMENVAFGLEILGYPSRTIKRRVPALLRLVGLGHKLHTRVEKLSGGEQQRVAIARAIALDPEILLADEPTGNLDPERTREIMDLLRMIHTRGTTIAFATHDQSLLNAYPYRRIVLKEGTLV
jgi:cell division transport system ATP-binding protein